MGHMTFSLFLTLLQFRVLCPAYTSVSPLKVKELFLSLAILNFHRCPRKFVFGVLSLREQDIFFPRRDREDLGRYSCLLQELLFFPTWVCTNSKVFSIFSILFCEHLRGLMEKRTAKICQLLLLVWPPATPHGLSTLGLY